MCFYIFYNLVLFLIFYLRFYLQKDLENSFVDIFGREIFFCSEINYLFNIKLINYVLKKMNYFLSKYCIKFSVY